MLRAFIIVSVGVDRSHCNKKNISKYKKHIESSSKEYWCLDDNFLEILQSGTG